MTSPITSDTDAGEWVSARVGASGFEVELRARTHALAADEPVSVGGTDRGPTPYELLLSALGSCSAMTMRMYANRKGWPLEGAVVSLRQGRPHERDCENCATETVGIDRIERRIELIGTLTDVQRARLLQIADRCPVKQTLERGLTIENVS